jgi:two-component system chemotaxis sensor kinase CheA
MEIDRAAFIDDFLQEFAENIASLDARILALKRDPENPDELATLLRELHTIKGSSRMLRFSAIEALAHGLESVFRGVTEGRLVIAPALVQLVFATTDQFRSRAEAIRETGSDGVAPQKLLDAYRRAYDNEPYTLETATPAATVPAEGGGASPDGQTAAQAVRRTVGLLRAAQKVVDGRPAAPALRGGGRMPVMGPPAIGSPETVRIKVPVIDDIVKRLNSLIIKQFQLRKENDALVEIEHAAEDPKRAPELLKLIRGLRRRFAEQLGLLERSTFEVQGNILGLRMLPLDLILGSLGKMVEETAQALGKEIRLAIEGSEIMLDRVILENLRDPVIHIVRNAVDHGIEDPATRREAGKPPEATIAIRCTAESGQVILRIRDDGGGVDYEAIRRRATEANPLHAEEIRSMDEGTLNGFLFTTGFSTAAAVTELSGRGIGLDIVRHNLERIKGRISLTSQRREGTEIVLSVPLSLATVSGFFVRAAGRKYLLPSNHIREMIVVNERDKLDLLNRTAVKLRDKIVPVHHLSDVLEDGSGKTSGRLHVAVVESGGEVIGIIVDEVIQYTSLIYKPLPRCLSALRPVQGIVFDESFNIICILHVPEIMRRFKTGRGLQTHRRFSAARSEYKRVLVVDDSFSTREIEKSILELEDYTVETAVDGIDAMEKLKERHFHLVVTDIYMPRMDGFTLVENLRRDERHSGTPIIVVSSEKDRSRRNQLMQAGINGFLDKADFDRANLVQEVRRLIG